MSDRSEYTRMQRFWSWLAVEAGKRAGLVALIALLVTLVLGYGVTKLQFATGQDSYLNTDDQVYVDNVEYQDLFGGQAMLVLFTLDDGVTITDFMNEANQQELARVKDELKANDAVIEAVITPTDILDWSDALIQSPDGNPINSIARSRMPRRVPRSNVSSMAIRSSGSSASFCRGGAACLLRTPAKTVAIARSLRSSVMPRWEQFQPMAARRRSMVETLLGLALCVPTVLPDAVPEAQAVM